jgi:hypothetical protein
MDPHAAIESHAVDVEIRPRALSTAELPCLGAATPGAITPSASTPGAACSARGDESGAAGAARAPAHVQKLVDLFELSSPLHSLRTSNSHRTSGSSGYSRRSHGSPAGSGAGRLAPAPGGRKSGAGGGAPQPRGARLPGVPGAKTPAGGAGVVKRLSGGGGGVSARLSGAGRASGSGSPAASKSRRSSTASGGTSVKSKAAKFNQRAQSAAAAKPASPKPFRPAGAAPLRPPSAQSPLASPRAQQQPASRHQSSAAGARAAALCAEAPPLAPPHQVLAAAAAPEDGPSSYKVHGITSTPGSSAPGTPHADHSLEQPASPFAHAAAAHGASPLSRTLEPAGHADADAESAAAPAAAAVPAPAPAAAAVVRQGSWSMASAIGNLLRGNSARRGSRADPPAEPAQEAAVKAAPALDDEHHAAEQVEGGAPDMERLPSAARPAQLPKTVVLPTISTRWSNFPRAASGHQAPGFVGADAAAAEPVLAPASLLAGQRAESAVREALMASGAPGAPMAASGVAAAAGAGTPVAAGGASLRESADKETALQTQTVEGLPQVQIEAGTVAAVIAALTAAKAPSASPLHTGPQPMSPSHVYSVRAAMDAFARKLQGGQDDPQRASGLPPDVRPLSGGGRWPSLGGLTRTLNALATGQSILSSGGGAGPARSSGGGNTLARLLGGRKSEAAGATPAESAAAEPKSVRFDCNGTQTEVVGVPPRVATATAAAAAVDLVEVVTDSPTHSAFNSTFSEPFSWTRWWRRSGAGAAAAAAAEPQLDAAAKEGDGGGDDDDDDDASVLSMPGNLRSKFVKASAASAAVPKVAIEANSPRQPATPRKHESWTLGRKAKAALLVAVVIIGMAGVAAPLGAVYGGKQRAAHKALSGAKAAGADKLVFLVDTAVQPPEKALPSWGCHEALGTKQVGGW